MSALVVSAAALLAGPAEVAGDPPPPHVTARYGSLHYRAPGQIRGTALSPDGKLLAVAGAGVVRLYEVPAWRVARELPGPGEPYGPTAPRPLVFSPDGKYLAYFRLRGTVTVWDLSADRPRRDFRAPTKAGWAALLAFVPGNQLAVADAATLFVYDPATGAEVRSVAVANVTHLSPDGRVYARADRPKGADPQNKPGVLVLGDAATGRDAVRLDRVPPRFDREHDGLAFAPDGKTFAYFGRNGWHFETRDTATGRLLSIPLLAESAYDVPPGGWRPRGGPEVGFTPDGAAFVTQLSGVWRFDPAAGAERPRLPAAGGPPPGTLHALPGGRTLLTPTGDGWVRVYAADGAEVPVPGRYRGPVSVALSRDGRLAAVADEAGRIDLRDAASGRFVRTVRERGGRAWRMAFSRDGARLAATDVPDDAHQGAPEQWPGAADGPPPVKVYRLADGAEVGAVGRGTAPSAGRVFPVGFTAAGLVLIQGDDPGLSAWDPATGAKVREYAAGCPGGAVSPDGRTVAAVDETALVFRDAVTGTEARRAVLVPPDLKWWDNNPCLVSWSADGRTAGVLLPKGMLVVVDAEAGRVRNRFEAVPDKARLPERWDGEAAEHGPVGLSPDGRWAAVRGVGHVTVWETATGRMAAGFGLDGWWTPLGLAFHPDGRSLILCRWGHAERVDLPKYFARDPVGPPAALWDRAAGADVEAATRAVFALMATADGRKVVKEKLPPAVADPDAASKVKGWVADLGSPDFATRDRAEKELTSRGRAFEPALREARAAATSPEVQRRLDAVLATAARGPSPADARVLRVVHAAELSDARDLLVGWAGGAAGAVLTDEAKAAVARLKGK